MRSQLVTWFVIATTTATTTTIALAGTSNGPTVTYDDDDDARNGQEGFVFGNISNPTEHSRTHRRLDEDSLADRKKSYNTKLRAYTATRAPLSSTSQAQVLKEIYTQDEIRMDESHVAMTGLVYTSIHPIVEYTKDKCWDRQNNTLNTSCGGAETRNECFKEFGFRNYTSANCGIVERSDGDDRMRGEWPEYYYVLDYNVHLTRCLVSSTVDDKASKNGYFFRNKAASWLKPVAAALSKELLTMDIDLNKTNALSLSRFELLPYRYTQSPQLTAWLTEFPGDEEECLARSHIVMCVTVLYCAQLIYEKAALADVVEALENYVNKIECDYQKAITVRERERKSIYQPMSAFRKWMVRSVLSIYGEDPRDDENGKWHSVTGELNAVVNWFHWSFMWNSVCE
eukprot:GHVQ01018316.1.p1 GENE.GHVQ01018316.1~~GHVQ01018316.1.p1  ORF type:complete len:399 (+),score=50.88 GHVQ01018316.1:180-1376(+)